MYRHTQVGWPSLVFLAGLIVLFGATAPAAALSWPYVALFALLFIVLAMFTTLTVEVTPSVLSVRFGPGPLGRRFPVEEIRSARPVRNRWWYGWGIRFTPHGWLYNVSGLDAVEIELEGGRCVRIGTDEPESLAAAIQISI